MLRTLAWAGIWAGRGEGQKSCRSRVAYHSCVSQSSSVTAHDARRCRRAGPQGGRRGMPQPHDSSSTFQLHGGLEGLVGTTGPIRRQYRHQRSTAAARHKSGSGGGGVGTGGRQHPHPPHLGSFSRWPQRRAVPPPPTPPPPQPPLANYKGAAAAAAAAGAALAPAVASTFARRRRELCMSVAAASFSATPRPPLPLPLPATTAIPSTQYHTAASGGPTVTAWSTITHQLSPPDVRSGNMHRGAVGRTLPRTGRVAEGATVRFGIQQLNWPGKVVKISGNVFSILHALR